MPESKSAVDGCIKRPSFISYLLLFICCRGECCIYKFQVCDTLTFKLIICYTDQLSRLLQLTFQSIIMVNFLDYSIIHLPNASLKTCLRIFWYFIQALFNLFDLIYRLTKKLELGKFHSITKTVEKLDIVWTCSLHPIWTSNQFKDKTFQW